MMNFPDQKVQDGVAGGEKMITFAKVNMYHTNVETNDSDIHHVDVCFSLRDPNRGEVLEFKTR